MSHIWFEGCRMNITMRVWIQWYWKKSVFLNSVCFQRLEQECLVSKLAIWKWLPDVLQLNQIMQQRWKSPQIKQFHKLHLWRNSYLKEKIQFPLLKLVLNVTLMHIFSGDIIEWYASIHIRNKAPVSYYSHYIIPITIMKLNAVISFSFFLLGKHIAWIREILL